jgi:DNA-binding CsgD family transcriptional regulator
MKAEGFSVREIARELGLSRMKVHRALSASPAAPAADAVPAVSDDPIMSLLTEADLECLGVSAADLVVGLSALDKYRCLGLSSAAGERARALFDHGRGRDAWSRWLHAAEGWVPVAGEPMPPAVRDRRIVELRRDGWTLAQIADALDLSEGGVSRAITRLAVDGGPGRTSRF